jgi:hypothetical protein
MTGSLVSRSYKSRSHNVGTLADPASVEVEGAKKRVLPAAGRAAMSKAAKKRWAKVKKQAKKAVS